MESSQVVVMTICILGMVVLSSRLRIGVGKGEAQQRHHANAEKTHIHIWALVFPLCTLSLLFTLLHVSLFLIFSSLAEVVAFIKGATKD